MDFRYESREIPSSTLRQGLELEDSMVGGESMMVNIRRVESESENCEMGE